VTRVSYGDVVAQIKGGTSGGEIAVSADGAFALVGDPAAHALTVVDVPNRKPTGTSISLPAAPGRIAISPDGRLRSSRCRTRARSQSSTSAAASRARPGLPVGGAPGAVAVTPDGAAILAAVPALGRLLIL